jgi:LPS sulfotransferase NodH
LESALKGLFDSEISDRLTVFLRNRGERARIVAPRWVRLRVLSGAQPRSATRAAWAEDPAEPGFQGQTSCNFIIMAEDAAQERSAIKSLVRRPGCRVFGFFQHVVPALICHVDGLAQPASTDNLKRYALLCVPRSGSRYLAATLWKAGVGAPLEHLREPLATIATQGGLGFASSIKSVESYGQANGIFGTKLVSTFLLDAASSRISILEKNVEWLAKRGYCFLHLERPLIESVVSSYIAVHLKKWHFFAPLDDKERERLEGAPFSENQIWGEYVRFTADKAIMHRLAKKHGIRTFPYDEVCNRTEQIVDWLCSQLSIDLSKLKRVASVQIPVATRTQSGMYEEFTGRLKELLHRRRDELDAEVLGRIAERTGLQRSAARKLLREYVEEASAFAAEPAIA